jgi:peroxiredoxin
VRIVGVSFDDAEANARWHDKKGFAFELWTDDDARTLAISLGAAQSTTAGHASRRTFLLDAEGRVLLAYDVGLDLGTHPSDVLADARRIWPERR